VTGPTKGMNIGESVRLWVEFLRLWFGRVFPGESVANTISMIDMLKKCLRVYRGDNRCMISG
jgi:hypothetical protein